MSVLHAIRRVAHVASSGFADWSEDDLIEMWAEKDRPAESVHPDSLKAAA